MKTIDSCQRVADRDPAIVGLADARRRRILSILSQESTSVREGDLARRLAASSGPTPDAETAVAGPDAVRATLRHVHLPALSTAGLVEWDERAATVTRSAHPLYEVEDVTSVLDAGEEYDEVFDCLANARPRAVLAALEEHGGTLDRSRLAGEILSRELANDFSVSTLERLHVSLRHVHLPKLAEAGLIEHGSQTVTLEADDRLEDIWVLLDALD